MKIGKFKIQSPNPNFKYPGFQKSRCEISTFQKGWKFPVKFPGNFPELSRNFALEIPRNSGGWKFPNATKNNKGIEVLHLNAGLVPISGLQVQCSCETHVANPPPVSRDALPKYTLWTHPTPPCDRGRSDMTLRQGAIPLQIGNLPQYLPRYGMTS